MQSLTSVALSTAVLFTIEPDIYQGEEVLNLKLRSARGSIVSELRLRIRVGPERFTIIDTSFHQQRSSHWRDPRYGDEKVSPS